ncbi:hypothetical protein BH09ACT7_BH09ACT7_15880 [soil metagenome]
MIAIAPTSGRTLRLSKSAVAAVNRSFQGRPAYSVSYFDYGVISRERHRL